MLIKSLQIGFMGLFLCVASAWAATSSIQGFVRDANGQPIKGADVRIASKDGKQVFDTVKTDRSGRYVSEGLPVGVYRLTLVVNGAVKASIGNTQTKGNKATELNLDLKPVAAGKATAEQKKGKHMVWVPAATGTHVGGRWVEVPEGGATEPGALNVQRTSAEQLQRQIQSASMSPPPVPP
jgi:Carboxypeptidase regulatory-like domain